MEQKHVTGPIRYLETIEDYYSQVACRGKTDTFLPDTTTLTDAQIKLRETRAKNICRGCKLIYHCLSDGMNHNEVGIWGGKTVQERQYLARKIRLSGASITPETTRQFEPNLNPNAVDWPVTIRQSSYQSA